MKWLNTSLLLLVPSAEVCYGWSSRSFIGRTTKNTHFSSTALKSRNDYNVVFRPSADPDSFDSFKIGTARVHRYADPSSMDEEAEYIMWYHARDSAMNDSDNSLPPLSTGRIGRATSRNGLIWERDEDGSYDSDKEGVSLGLNTESWWGFDTAHIGLGQVLLPMVSPSIRSEGGVYVMYYMGGSHEETPIADYVNSEKGAQVGDAKIKGMKLKIGAAISQDGVTWGRIEGDDPSGACMVPFDASNDDSLDFGKDHPEELYTGWPEVRLFLTAQHFVIITHTFLLSTD